eukprot:488410_1
MRPLIKHCLSSYRRLRTCTTPTVRSTRRLIVTSTRLQIHRRYRSPALLHFNTARFCTHNNDKYDQVKTELIDILRKIDHPSDKSKDIVYLGLIKNIKISEKQPDSNLYILSIDLELDRHYRELKKQITDTITSQMTQYNIDSIRINMAPQPQTKTSPDDVLKNVKHIIAVSSCKGGVGKSSIAVNLAYTLAKMDHYVGIFDADIYGPSLPTMTSVNAHNAQLTQDKDTQLLNPIVYEGVKLMSFGYVPQSQENATNMAAMRGPMVSNVIQQLLFQTNWGALDYLIIDLPPGTSDIHLTLTQKLNITAAVVVTTPQLLSQIDVVKGIEMLRKVNVPTVALVKNMTYYVCKDCGSKQDLFSNKSAKLNSWDFKQDFGINHIFELPIYPLISEFGDYGDPIVLNNDGEVNQIFDAIAKGVMEEVDELMMEENAYTWQIDKAERRIKFVNKEEEFEIGLFDLRYICRCALCVDEMTNQQILTKEDIKTDIEISFIESCGNYAVKVIWSDKHDSIYAFDAIKKYTCQ